MNSWIKIQQAVSSRILNSFLMKEKTRFWLAGKLYTYGWNNSICRTAMQPGIYVACMSGYLVFSCGQLDG